MAPEGPAPITATRLTGIFAAAVCQTAEGGAQSRKLAEKDHAGIQREKTKFQMSVIDYQ